MLARVALALLLVSSAACSVTGMSAGRKTYKAPGLAMPVVRDDIFSVVTDHVREAKWTIVSATPASGRLEALTPADESLGVPMRERWVFAIVDYEVRVSRQLEVAFEKGKWEREEEVCLGYAYVREHQVLDGLNKRVAQVLTTKKYATVTPKGRS